MTAELAAFADEMVQAALNGDAAAFREVVAAFDEDESIVDDDSQRKSDPGMPLRLYQRENESPERVVAAAALDPATRAAMSEHELLGGRFVQASLDINALVDVLREQVRRVTDMDLDRGEAMLAAQAHTLDAIYNKLLSKALIQEQAQYIEMFFKLALRAQSQCRATWEAISAIQNPPIAGYVKQANIAHNQQVNNGPVPARTEETRNSPSKLLEQTTHEPDQWMDRGAPRAATNGHSAVETVDKVDRA